MIREIKGLKCPNHDRIRDGHRFIELASEDDVEIYPNEDYDKD